MEFWILIIVGLFVLLLGWLIYELIIIYNKFQYWYIRAKRKFADIDVYLQERIDKILALTQIVKKYDIHEYKTLKDTIEARSRWTKDSDFNEKVKYASELENNFMKIQAVFEKYPKLKAEALHLRLLDKNSKVESKLRQARLEYNRIVQKYNERVNIFPRNIVARLFGFKELNYIKFELQEKYDPKHNFEDL